MDSPIAPLHSLTLDLPPSCVEVCPAYPDFVCVGTYSLEQDEARAQGDTSRPQNRNGSIILFKTEGTSLTPTPPTRKPDADYNPGDRPTTGTDRCHVKTVAQPSAILDLHFQPAEGKRNVLAVASSIASLSIFRLEPSKHNQTPELELASVIRIDNVGEDVLFLSCAWHPSIPDLIAVTTSTGLVHVMTIDLTQRSVVAPQAAVLTHTLEAWTAAFSPYTPQLQIQATAPSDGDAETGNKNPGLYTTIYSGSDDSLLKYTSCALPTRPFTDKGVQHTEPYGTCRLTDHGAGVTAILPVLLTNADGGRIIVTGSYDDHIRVFSVLDPMATGGIRRATCLAEQDLGGGVWRLKLISQSASDGKREWSMRLLASCMHAGARVIDIEGDMSGACQISVAARFEEHKSMNYGSDFVLSDSLLCISTSFYDKLLCTWEAKH